MFFSSIKNLLGPNWDYAIQYNFFHANPKNHKSNFSLENTRKYDILSLDRDFVKNGKIESFLKNRNYVTFPQSRKKIHVKMMGYFWLKSPFLL